MAYKERSYRSWAVSADLIGFRVVEQETDLAIYACRDLEKQARASVLTCRQIISDYIKDHPEFYTALKPVEVSAQAPHIVRTMAEAGSSSGTGPMAAVAGAIAESVGRDLLGLCDEVIVENGGDIFLRTEKSRTMGVFAGERSAFTGKVVLEIAPAKDGLGVCTSSGTVSHSLSFGKSDALVILSPNAALADAVATAAGNMLKDPSDIEKCVDFAKSIDGITGIIAIARDKMGTWGDIKLI